MKCTIDLAPSGVFTLTIPSVIEGQSHDVSVPATGAGVAILKKILTERQRQSRREIGNDSSPVQAQVEAWLNTERRERSARIAKPDEDEPKKKIDLSALNLEELDL